MKFVIKHEIKGRMRIHILQKPMTFAQADTLQYYLSSQPFVESVKVRDRLSDASIRYSGSREELIEVLKKFQYETVNVPEAYLQNSGRELNRQYWDKLVDQVVFRIGNVLFFPPSLKAAVAAAKSVRYIWKGVCTLAKGKIEVPVLDATAIGVSILRNDTKTASSIMFLLGVGEILEEWTHKKSVGDLARSMSLNVSKVWLWNGEQEILVPVSSIKTGDMVRIHMGNVIPFDGTV
ncbi:MAG TPA: heavy metal translocating P-type ATPase, partial [Candidatus Lachnoclostridium stercoravium]|nr:heavy metal translocating P-type ATPase [Candidatus Lachnoclostridium stercoravium]